MSIVAQLLWAVVGGVWGASLVGFGEALVVAWTTAPDELGVFPFAIVGYGAVGAGVGLAAGLVWSLFAARGRSGRSSHAAGAVGAMAALLPLGFAVTRYHVAQRVFQEGLPLASPTGLLVHAAILAALGLVAFLVSRCLRQAQAAPRGLALVGLAWLGLYGIGRLVAFFGDHTAPPVVERRASADPSSHPNIILIIADTLRADAVKTADDGFARLVRDGVVFENTYAQASWTRPSVATILTSQYPAQHGAIHKTHLLSNRVTTLAEALAAEGYWTAGIVTNINMAPVFNFQQGFGEYTYLEPSFYFGASVSAAGLALYKGLRVVREKLLRDRIYFENYYQDAAVVGEAVEAWLEQKPPEPFFLLVHYMDPHDPFFEIPYNGKGVARVIDQNPDPSQAPRMRDLYHQNIGYLEEHLDALLQNFAANGHYDRSVIALTSDHGEEFQEHGGWWHGTTLYEEQLRVPLVIKPKAGARSPGVESRRARLLDVAPTLMRAAGLEPSSSFVGVDLFQSPPAEPIHAEVDHEGNRVNVWIEGDWKLITANPDNPRGLRSVELYDLANDPHETNDLAAREPARVEAMVAALQRFAAQLRGE